MDTNQKSSVLLLDDDRRTADTFAELLGDAGYDITVCTTLDDAIAQLAQKPFAVVVSDLCLGKSEGTELLPHVKAAPSKPQIIFITGHGSVDTAVAALHEGAFDYISKPENLRDIEADLRAVVAKALKHRTAMSRNPKMAQPEAKDPVRMLIGRSPAMVQIYRFIAKAALTRENVLITGESGTGKELVATAIHEKGPWATKPFVTVNCCALTETLLESELFGHVRGSFTGATGNKRGLFEEADGGTLFLDEIGDIPQSLQVKLLRAIQEGEIKPVGASESRRVDVRVIAATHRNLKEYVASGKFREDLYYRLKVLFTHLPPLKQRQQDLPELVSHFLERASRRAGRPLARVSDEAMEFLLRYPWPGNIRELENVIGHAVSMSNTNVLFPEDFAPEIFHFGEEEPLPLQDGAAAEPAPAQVAAPSVTQSLEEVEKAHIQRVLESVYYNKSKAAAILRIDRVTLYRKAFRYGIFGRKDGAGGLSTPSTTGASA